MGYLHIQNLYRQQDILLFKEAYALEKIHGTSAHVKWGPGGLSFFSGGENHTRFVELFNGVIDAEKMAFLFADKTVTVFGEAYGGKQQGMSKTYGPNLKFVVFDVLVDETFLNVPDAENVTKQLGLEFVHYERIEASVADIDECRDQPSQQAIRNGCGDNTDRFGFCPPIREGIVLRPIQECRFNNGGRVIAKHKRAEFSERATPVPVDEAAREVLRNAEAVATEWVVPMRLTHVLDKLGNPTEMSNTGKVIEAMIEDVMREADGEVEDAPAVRRAIGKAAAKLYKEHVSRVV